MFWRFLFREDYIPSDVARLLEQPVLWQTVPEILTIQEIELLLKQPDPSTFQGARDLAILEILYGAGLRVSELCALSIYDVDDHFVKVIGKGKKERLVPLGKKSGTSDRSLLTLSGCLERNTRGSSFFVDPGKPNRSFLCVERDQALCKKGRDSKRDFSPYAPSLFCHSFNGRGG